jgi:hypothetical protein
VISALLLLIALCLIVGSALDTSNLCVVRAARDLTVGRPAIAVGCLVSLALASIVFYANTRLGWRPQPPAWSYPTARTLVGAVIFALGTLVNGACAMGTFGRLARGDIGFLATLGGALTVALLIPRTIVPNAKPSGMLLTDELWLAAILACVGIAMLLSRRHLELTRILSYAMLGLLAAIVTNWQGDWTWLTLLHHVGAGVPFDFVAVGCLLAVLIGATLTAIYHRRFRFVRPTLPTLLREAAGGGMMAAGALLIPGGNDALLVYGIPSGSPHALAGFAVIFATMVVMLWVTPWFRAWANRPSPAARS